MKRGQLFPREREVKFVHLGLPEARFYIACTGHMHVFSRAGYRSGTFIEDARHSPKATGAAT